MGMTVHYRGSLADLSRVEDFEDRVIDFALALGGDPRIWRSAEERDPQRLVRGLILDLAPGQESTSLLISPEGWLIGLMEIEAAERGELTEKPWCWVKTQFGTAEGHVALVELLTALKAEFIPDLEVRDESDYWDHRDVEILQQKMSFLSRAINALGDALERDRLSPEAAEDPEILATRVARIAQVVRQNLLRTAKHPPVDFPPGEEHWQIDARENEALWDELYRVNRRKQEQILRVMDEFIAQGVETDSAYTAALELVVGYSGDVSEEHVDQEDEFGEAVDWSDDFTDAGDKIAVHEERHPLMERATQLLMALNSVTHTSEQRTATVDSLMRGMSEVCGGLVQALSHLEEWKDDPGSVGLSLVQLKRALRGAAFVLGGLYQLGADRALSEENFQQFKNEIDEIQTEIVGLIKELRAIG